MSITFSCPSCGKGYKVPEEYAGRSTKCQQCGTALTVPRTGAITSAPPAAVPAPYPAVASVAGSQGGWAKKQGRGSYMLVGGIVAAILVVGVGGAAAYWLLAGSSAAADSMKYLPSESQINGQPDLGRPGEDDPRIQEGQPGCNGEV
jgi:hypothetical protein